MNARVNGATGKVRECLAEACQIPLDRIADDDDFVDDLVLLPYELESFMLVLEAVFDDVKVPVELFKSPLYRTPASLAEWLVRQSDAARWRSR